MSEESPLLGNMAKDFLTTSLLPALTADLSDTESKTPMFICASGL